jgi:hypothetical protein
MYVCCTPKRAPVLQSLRAVSKRGSDSGLLYQQRSRFWSRLKFGEGQPWTPRRACRIQFVCSWMFDLSACRPYHKICRSCEPTAEHLLVLTAHFCPLAFLLSSYHSERWLVGAVGIEPTTLAPFPRFTERLDSNNRIKKSKCFIWCRLGAREPFFLSLCCPLGPAARETS